MNRLVVEPFRSAGNSGSETLKKKKTGIKFAG